MDAEGWPDVRWIRAVECAGDRNEDKREDGGSGRKEEEEKEEERRGRKEGVRARVRLGVGGAIRNYCGTIDKRRLRGRTTEDSLRPSDFSSCFRAVASLFRLFSLFLTSLGLPFLASCRPTPMPMPLPTKPSRLVNM